jgi:hypothetical protein
MSERTKIGNGYSVSKDEDGTLTLHFPMGGCEYDLADMAAVETAKSSHMMRKCGARAARFEASIHGQPDGDE